MTSIGTDAFRAMMAQYIAEIDSKPLSIEERVNRLRRIREHITRYGSTLLQGYSYEFS